MVALAAAILARPDVYSDGCLETAIGETWRGFNVGMISTVNPSFDVFFCFVFFSRNPTKAS